MPARARFRSVLVQLSGVPGSGKSTLARSVAGATGFVVVDTDVLKDSPCRYQELLDSGRQVARANGVRYAFVELWVRDWSAVLSRLDARSPRLSQVASATAPVPGTEWEFGTAEETLAAWQTQLVRPAHDWLRLDAESAVDQNLSTALRHLGPH